ncbi:MAG: methionyl-tRNA formyltransferase, partial [Pseudomonadota bacterium]|nr:methionyl-tRNA formyltransferase [Pseudomonadota bacterium]
MRLVFAGSPEFSATILQALIESDHDIVAVYTQPDKPVGRGRKIQQSKVKQLAQSHDIPVEQPTTLKTNEAQSTLAAYQADLMIVVAYGMLLPKDILETPAKGCVNIHTSLLPRWRGAAPIQRAIEAGDEQTGVTIMQMDEGLDTGAMLHQATLTLAPDETSSSLFERLQPLSISALLTVLADYDQFASNAKIQDDAQACYAAKLSKEEARINWQEPASVIDRKLRAFTPWPIGYSELDELTVRFWQAQPAGQRHSSMPGQIVDTTAEHLFIACGEQSTLRVSRLQLPNKPQ